MSAKPFEHKSTVEFSLGGIGVDLTFSNGPHGAGETSRLLLGAVSALPPPQIQGLRVFCALLRARILSHRRGRGMVRGNIKHCHWAMMAVCAIRSAGPAALSHAAAVFEFLRQYFAEVDLEKVVFDLRIPGCTVRSIEPPGAPAAKCIDPLSNKPAAAARNLVAAVSKGRWAEIQQSLKSYAAWLDQPGDFWMSQKSDWL